MTFLCNSVIKSLNFYSDFISINVTVDDECWESNGYYATKSYSLTLWWLKNKAFHFSNNSYNLLKFLKKLEAEDPKSKVIATLLNFFKNLRISFEFSSLSSLETRFVNIFYLL